MKNFLKRNLFIVFIGLMTFSGCSDDDDNPRVIPGEQGFFIVNEGLFGAGNASLSFFNKQTEEIQNDVFFEANNRPLGDQAQSMIVTDGRGYVVVQNSNKIEVINAEDFTSITTIDENDGLQSPRYLLVVSDSKAYISDWGPSGATGFLRVLDLNTNEITNSISVGFGPNRMVLSGDNVYLTHSGRFNDQTFEFIPDQTLMIINTNTDAVTTEIELGDNSNAAQVDNAGNVWVSGAGNLVFGGAPDFALDLDASTSGYIARISPNNVILFELPVKGTGPNNLEINPNGDLLYFNYQGAIVTASTTLNSSNEIEINSFISKSFYGFSVDPVSGEFIGGVAPNFTSDGSIERYTTSGTLIDSYTVGIGPNGAVFK
ncbi:MAG: DUF5074 domain-containing protein [Bacteroidota bacterium]